MKIDIYYKDSKGIHHYIHSTNIRKTVKDAVKSTKNYLKTPAYFKAESKKVGEDINFDGIYGRKAKI